MSPDPIALSGRRYVIRAPLGVGGMGVVYRAFDRLYGREVALKRLALPTATLGHRGSESHHNSGTLAAIAGTLLQVPPARGPGDAANAPTQLRGLPLLSAPDAVTLGRTPPRAIASPPSPTPIPATPGPHAPSAEELRLALAHEFHTLSSLRHPHIISVLDYGFDPNRQPYFTMELLHDGCRLSDAARALPLGERIRLLLQVLQALTYLHRRGVLHRDLKPANILVVGAGDAANVKLLDFGLAVLRRHQTSLQHEVSGTLGYIAPELLLGHAADEASDLYALGVVAYELLVGRVPFAQLHTSELLFAPASDTLDWGVPDVPTQFAPFLQRLLARAPGDRYPSADAAARDLLRLSDRGQPLENEATRESFLQAAEMVGRAEEMARLCQALEEAQSRRGSVWLLGGESGVGKSRLCDELRAQAQVRGAWVLRGQAVRQGRSGAALFTQALRALSLEVELSELEASVLKTLIPDLPTLLDRDIPDPPTLSAQATRLRLLLVAESVLLRTPHPILLLLEDLQWTDAGSIDLLRRLSEQIGDKPLLIVGTFRDEERPHLSADLPRAQPLKLGRLKPDAIGTLVDSMLGSSPRRAQLIQLLLRESEGNTFFIVEVMRALADEAGGLSAIVEHELPQRVFAGGVQSALQRRLRQIPPPLRPILCVAAVAGRQLDLAVLGQAARQLATRSTEGPQVDLDAWLRRCADVGVLEVSEQQWRFSHDKLREQVIAELAAEEKRDLHRQVASAIVAAYPDASTQAAALAYHYDEAGDRARAGKYAGQAGEQSVARGALADARLQLGRAIELFPHTDTPPHMRVRLYRLLLNALFGLGLMAECGTVLRQALADLHTPLPSGGGQQALAILREVVRQGAYRLYPRLVPHSRTEAETLLLEEQFRLHEIIAEYFLWHSQSAPGIHSLLLSANRAEEHGAPHTVAAGGAILAFLFCLTPFKALATSYCQRSQQLLQPDMSAEVTVFVNRAIALTCACAGEAEETLRVASVGLRLARGVGDIYAQMHLLLIQWIPLRTQGQLAAARAAADQLLALALASENEHFQTTAHGLLGGDLLRRGRLAEARAALERSAHLAESRNYTEGSVFYEGMRALCALRQGDTARARALAEQALRAIDQMVFSHDGAYDGYPACVETLCSLWESASERALRAHTERLLLRGIGVLRRYSFIFPNGLSCLHLFLGRYLFGRGLRAAGLRQIRRAEQIATQRGMLYEAALAQAWWGRFQQDAQGVAELTRAHAALRQLGADWDADRVDGWLHWRGH